MDSFGVLNRIRASKAHFLGKMHAPLRFVAYLFQYAKEYYPNTLKKRNAGGCRRKMRLTGLDPVRAHFAQVLGYSSLFCRFSIHDYCKKWLILSNGSRSEEISTENGQ